MTELETRVAPMGAIAAHLYSKVRDVADLFAAAGRNLGETFILGDNPLALLTALQSSFEPATTSSRFVYTWLDVRLMLEDLFLKLQATRQ